MRSFLSQLATSDAVAEDGMKVIAYFDALVEHRATLEACVRAAAALSQCTAGLRDVSSPAGVRFNRRGQPVDGMPAPTTIGAVRIGDRDVGEVWLEREDGAALLDELIVERMAQAAGVLWRTSPRPSRSTAGLIELLVSADASQEDRNRALQLLGIAPDQPIDVVAVASSDADQLASGLAGVHNSLRERTATGTRPVTCSALLGNVGFFLAQPSLADDALPGLPAGFAAGTARGRPAGQAAESWQHAQTALQFCGLLGFGNVLDYSDLGAIATLAQLPPCAVTSNSDVRAIGNLMTTTRGRAVLETLQQRLASGSIRETAVALYLHHSSVRYRLRQAEEALGFELESPRSRLRAELALVLWRLSKT